MKPGFFKNEELSAFPAMHRLCFAGLWLLADKSGRLEDRPRRIKGELFPYENAEVETILADLAAAGFLFRYVVNTIPIIQIVNFEKHQRPHKQEPVSQLPPHVESLMLVGESLTPPAQFARRTGTENGDGERRTGIGVDKVPTPTRDFLKWFVDEYKRRRNGATYSVKPKHGGIVKHLLLTFEPARLQQHATILLTTDEDWTETTDRGIEVLAGKINWLEERLTRWERKQARVRG